MRCEVEWESLKQRQQSSIVPHARPPLPRMLADIALKPRATFRAAREGGWFDWRLALLFLVALSAVEAAVWVATGQSRGGNALKVLYVGDTVPGRLQVMNHWSPAMQFPVLLAAKVGADLFIMGVTHRFARLSKAPRGTFKEWFAAYGYILAILDLYFIFATGIAILPGERALAVSHILLAITLAWIVMVYTWAYGEVYGLDDDKAYRNFVVFFLAIPVAFLAPAVLLLPG